MAKPVTSMPALDSDYPRTQAQIDSFRENGCGWA
jgi:hypothetical protein